MPAEGRENPLLKKGNSDAFFREKYLTKNKHPQMRVALLEGLCKFFESCRCPFPSWGAAPTVLHVTDLEDGLVK